MNDTLTLAAAEARDAADPLAHFRSRFALPADDAGNPLIYLCGNSLGLQPASAVQYVNEELEDWKRQAVEGHFRARRPWMPYHELLTAHTATLVGAEREEVVSMNTLTVNLHLLMVSFYRPTPERYKILIERPAFPSDRYAVLSQLKFHGYDPDEALVEIAPRDGETAIRADDIAALLKREGHSIALVMLPGVQYYSGQVFDMATVTRQAHAAGCTVGLDLAHAVGNVELSLHEWNVDFAAWCTYKYLNAGPGAVGGAFVHARHADFDGPRFAGWWGHDKTTRFRMGPDFHPMRGAEGWQLSNPPILSLAPVVASLQVFDEAGMPALRKKSIELTGFLDALLRARLDERIEILTPHETASRGCQLSLRVRAGAGRALFERLAAAGIVGDWREPDVIRIAPVPLYNRFTDAWEFVTRLEKCLND